MRQDTKSPHPSAVRQACMSLLETEYQLSHRFYQLQTEPRTFVSDADPTEDLYKLMLPGGCSLVALILLVVMSLINLGGVARGVAQLGLLIAGVPTAFLLLRLLLKIPVLIKGLIDERRMKKKWDSYHKAEKDCDNLRQQLVNALPIQEGKRFVHIPPQDAEMNYSLFKDKRFLLGSGINFVEKDGKPCVDGMLDMQPCDANLVQEVLDYSELICLHFDRAYLQAHPEETYLWGSIYHFTHTAQLKSHTTKYDQIDVGATMANYGLAFDRAEREISSSGRTHQESYDIGKMSFADYRTAEDFKERMMDREREELKLYNDRRTISFYYFDEVTQDVYTAGFVITSQSGRLIYAGHFKTKQDLLNFTYRLPRHEDTKSNGKLSNEVANVLQGELTAFEQPSNNHPVSVSGRMIMEYVLIRFHHHMSPLDPLQVIPAGMSDKDFRYWVELRYRYSIENQ
ncbi:MAG: hypothetical protein E7319_04995 [Clostridiales bacterium]|nr:hypothetical protein [Clostridiales bacterium]